MNSKTILQCPYCPNTGQPRGLAMHIRWLHPDQWKGSLLKSIPGEPIVVSEPDPEQEKPKRKKKGTRKTWREKHQRPTKESARSVCPPYCPLCGGDLEEFGLAMGYMLTRLGR